MHHDGGPGVPVLVVGAGPTGLAVATLLAQHGVACTVVDRHHRPTAAAAVHLDGEAVRVLQRLGVDEEFAAISRPAAGLRLLDARLRPFATFRRALRRARTGTPRPTCSTSPTSRPSCAANLSRHPG